MARSICSCTHNIGVFVRVHEYNKDTSIQNTAKMGKIQDMTQHNNILMSIKFYIKHNMDMGSMKQLGFVTC